jgi:hypothetical protein
MAKEGVGDMKGWIKVTEIYWISLSGFYPPRNKRLF